MSAAICEMLIFTHHEWVCRADIKLLTLGLVRRCALQLACDMMTGYKGDNSCLYVRLEQEFGLEITLMNINYIKNWLEAGNGVTA